MKLALEPSINSTDPVPAQDDETDLHRFRGLDSDREDLVNVSMRTPGHLPAFITELVPNLASIQGLVK